MRVVIATYNDRTFNVEVMANDSVQSLKEKIEAAEGIPVSQQYLIFSPFTGRDFYMKNPAGNIVGVNEDDAVGIAEENLIDTRKDLANHRLLSDYSIEMFNSPRLILYRSKKMTVIVQHATGKRTPLVVKPWVTIKAVMQKIQGKDGIPLYLQRLKGGSDFDESRTLFDYNVKDNDTIFLKLPRTSLGLFVETPEGKIIKINSHDYETIGDVKKQIEFVEGIPAHRQHLVFKPFIGKKPILYDPADETTPIEYLVKSEDELEDDKALSHYNFHLYTSPHLNLHIQSEMQIIICTLSGKKLQINVKPWDTIRIVKEMILNKEGIPVDQQRLMYGGRLLEDDRTFASYDIRKDNTLHLILRIRGGY